ncbi:MAG: recombinase family protein, partial [Sphingobacteriales bacterium]
MRVKVAIRQGLKQGKCMGRAPYGYYNDKNTKLVHIDSATQDLVNFAFQTFATGAYSIEEVRHMAILRGCSLQKQQFINMLSNPFYIGKIFIKALADEPEQFIDGLHDPIVDRQTFTKVQEILAGKKKPYLG